MVRRVEEERVAVVGRLVVVVDVELALLLVLAGCVVAAVVVGVAGADEGADLVGRWRFRS